MSLWPAANGPELFVNGVNSGAALSYSHPLKEHIPEDFGKFARVDYSHSAIAIPITAAYTIDDGDSLIPAADPLFLRLTPPFADQVAW